MAESVDPDQTAPIGAVCSVSTLFVSILDSSVMLVAAAKNHINKKNYSMKYHVILGRFKWLINGFTEFMIEQ